MRPVNVAAAVLALLALAGCTTGSNANAPFGSQSSSATTIGSSPAPTTLSSPSESQPTPPPPISAAPLEGGQTEVPPTQVDSGALGFQEQAWTSADGRTIRVIGSEGGCDRVRAEITAQSGDQVLITLVTTKYKATVCTADIRNVPLNVTLDAPLGSRRITVEAREEAP
ncbi:hypothetical protein LZG04_39625 [Saccharothrix sp. S26]|uniref:hypothetical protein n=1 Tax=Saccharothrix sp. S26 TaxID=2907215 RepID=UPI001F29007B|nr:hypothetical protein [Saccharothrix sp. S26]MCE7000885.1 hypothetical protein [Saccharothrix sp. S26]